MSDSILLFGAWVLNHRLFIIVLLIIGMVFLSAEEKTDVLEVDVSISPGRLSRGQEGKVIVKLDIKKGISINPQPSFIIEFQPVEELIFPKDFYTASDLEIEITKEGGREYLIFNDPIEIPFTVSLEAETGRHQLEGKIKYFACCKDEEWCLKSSTEFTTSYYTRGRSLSTR